MPVRRAVVTLLGCVLMLCLAGCGAHDGGCAGVIDYADPVFRLASVTDARTGAAISRVTLRDIVFGGNAVNPPFFGVVDGKSYGITVAGDTLVCDVPCGFGFAPGTYEFTISAVGHKPLRVVREGRFQGFHSGCPSYHFGSTELRLTLEPE